MSTLTKLALGVMGQLRPRPARGDAKSVIKLPAPDKTGGLPLMQALAKRRSSREFLRKPLPLPVLADHSKASYENGVLKIELTKAKQGNQKVQTIKVN